MREDWVKISYKETVKKISLTNKKLKQKEYLKNGNIPIIDQGQELIGGYTNDESKIVECNLPSIVFGDHTKIVKLINFPFAPGADGTKVIEPKKHLNPKLLKYFTEVLALKIKDKGYARHYQDIEKSLIPIPPLLEQKVIVAKIEQLFSELDSGIMSIKRAKEKLKIYRQAVLKKAFEGELTKAWREKQTDLPTADELLEQIKKEREEHYKKQLDEWKKAVKEWEESGKVGKKPSKISKPNTLDKVTKKEVENYGNLPKLWKWERFNNVTYKIGDIDHKMPKQFDGGIPYLSTGNIYADGTLDFNKAKTISKADYKRLSLKIKPELNDIIFPRYGTIGRNVIVNTDRPFLVSYSCAIIKNIDRNMNHKYVYYYSISPVIKKEIKKYTVQTTQANIGIASIENFVFPLCSLQEQTQIVQEIEKRLSVCDKMEATIETALQKSEALRQSILKKAFEGRLLSDKELQEIRNHPDFESAEALLERIKREKEGKQ